ncbi:molybdate ABC transporter substrate-binding protein [Corynebacterium sp. NML98-0116]|uniref:molybdate ABC transporter substrate-binding protein n=1 Tax=unclassified Corynebacterium TaxID=2624378 RepID=UPI00087847B9|nr:MULTISPECIES: molybdate ABC transporter substrate-binding protein [unclassified Corynebacterium]AOX05765.1 molybdate ABC transporter substrate-binding protein [Corynebacterium sp. NML98-0116]MCQ4609468.1 molybdate ABC transporter substrate-binding protein [Corynebacterium sp. CCUG 61414]MDK8244141.1 molybdate ABC transporter substrate-binding protein [Corynebacterium sp. UMB10321]OFT28341.1 molybdenum ABC transporter substrate-binding protein [Corynebacterium sp. HMSC08D02]
MRSTRLATLFVAALAATGLTACAGGTDSESAASKAPTAEAPSDLIVMGAASTRVLNEDLSEMSENNLEFVNAGSSDLVQQLKEGAPGDVLITADQKNMDKAVEAGVAKDPKVVATNSMVLVVPKGNPADIKSVEDVQKDGVNLVVCDAQVPCGSVTNELVTANNLTINPVSLEHSVSDTLGKVVSGEADAGFVYRTDAAAAGDAVEVLDIPHADEKPNSLVAAVTTNTTDEAAAQNLFELLASPEMAVVWEKYGFTPAAQQ